MYPQPPGLVRFELGTKAETLSRLQPILCAATILPLVYFRHDEWRRNRDYWLDAAISMFGAGLPLIVRSSAAREGTDRAATSGKFRTEANVLGRDAIGNAVDAVFASYAPPAAADQVLVQPFLTDVALSGVASTFDPATGGPYRVVNWATGADTTQVTAGKAEHMRTWYCARGARDVALPHAHLALLLPLLDELEELTRCRGLVIEYAVTSSDTLVLFQAVPLPAAPQPDSDATDAVVRVATQIETLQRDIEARTGQRPSFGVMPDWNPAEMIGLRPRPLALSLYRHLITDEVWTRARAAYGYREVRDRPLMVDFAGLPYIDVSASFESLIPCDIDDATARRLLGIYLRRLRQNPDLHDKVEFEVLVTCLTPSSERRLATLTDAGLAGSERDALRASLRRLINAVLSPDGPWRGDIERLHRLESERSSPGDSFDHAFQLLRDCKLRGTLAFAGLARAAFIGMELLRSLVQEELLSQADCQRFLEGLNGVTSDLLADYAGLSKGAFLDRYGHLRPSSYDITALRYDEAPDSYFDWAGKTELGRPRTEPFALANTRPIDAALAKAGLQVTAAELLRFIGEMLVLRERAKLAFTRLLSDSLLTIKRAGARLGFSADDLSFVTYEALVQAAATPDPATALSTAVAGGRQSYEMTRQLALPPLIFDSADARSFELPRTTPTFVTQKRCRAPLADLAHGDDPAGAIVLLESADPGYDWIFARDIRGLITAFGGANSHMAIRAAELGIPAAIGVGMSRLQSLRLAKAVELDAENRLITPLAADALGLDAA